MVGALEFVSSISAIRRHHENSQWWPADILRRWQFAQLEPLIDHAYRTVPWYRQRFDDCGFQATAIVDSDLWRALPVLTRSHIQAAGTSLHSDAPPAGHGRVATKWTSGSTATPLMVLKSGLTSRIWTANSLRQYAWQQCDMREKLALVRNVPRGTASVPDGDHSDRWGIAIAAGVASGPCCVLDVRSTTAEQAQWLTIERPAYLQTYPSIVRELAHRFAATGDSLPGLKTVITFGEILDAGVRDVCRRAWNVDIMDSYSTHEVGHIAAQCSHLGPYHVHAEHLLVEVLDEDDQPCEPGEIGRVIVTDLFNYAMPLIRYEIGDLAEVGGPCGCGRNLPTLSRILGRERNMFVLPNGEKRWPAMEVDALGAFQNQLPVRQFQAIQRSRDEIEVKLVVARPLVHQEEAGIRSLIATWFSEGFNVRFNYVDEIPRGAGGKFEDFRCEIAPSE